MRADAPSIQPLEERLLNRLKAAEAELAFIRSQLQQQQRLAMLGTLAAGVAHEINNLLTPVLAYAQLAEARPHDQELLRRLLEKTLVGVRQASEVSEAILGFASPRPQQPRAQVRQVLHSAMQCLGRDPARDGIECSISIPAATWVAMTPLALQQVLLNLLLNAVAALKATRRPKLTIDSSQTGSRIMLRIADNGPGIDPSIARQLFQPFTHAQSEGTGLGLWVCQTLLEQVDGSITVASTPGSGTTFTVSLPIASVGEQDNVVG